MRLVNLSFGLVGLSLKRFNSGYSNANYRIRAVLSMVKLLTLTLWHCLHNIQVSGHLNGQKRVYLQALVVLFSLFSFQTTCFAESFDQVYFDKLVQAIYKAEGGANTRHPYGILQKYKKTTPKQACYNTVKSVHKKWVKAGKPKPYLDFLAEIYCPVGAKNDPTGLNRHWKGNVKRFLNA